MYIPEGVDEKKDPRYPNHVSERGLSLAGGANTLVRLGPYVQASHLWGNPPCHPLPTPQLKNSQLKCIFYFENLLARKQVNEVIKQTKCEA
jgi:hypothetical protein